MVPSEGRTRTTRPPGQPPRRRPCLRQRDQRVVVVVVVDRWRSSRSRSGSSSSSSGSGGGGGGGGGGGSSEVDSFILILARPRHSQPIGHVRCNPTPTIGCEVVLLPGRTPAGGEEDVSGEAPSATASAAPSTNLSTSTAFIHRSSLPLPPLELPLRLRFLSEGSRLRTVSPTRGGTSASHAPPRPFSSARAPPSKPAASARPIVAKPASAVSAARDRSFRAASSLPANDRTSCGEGSGGGRDDDEEDDDDDDDDRWPPFGCPFPVPVPFPFPFRPAAAPPLPLPPPPLRPPPPPPPTPPTRPMAPMRDAATMAASQAWFRPAPARRRAARSDRR